MRQSDVIRPAPETQRLCRSSSELRLRRKRKTFVGGTQALVPECEAADWPAVKPTFCRLWWAHRACAGRERARLKRPPRYLKLNSVMEPSRGFAEAEALSPEQTARYLRYIWDARRAWLAGPGPGPGWGEWWSGPRTLHRARTAEAELCETRAVQRLSSERRPGFRRLENALVK